MIDEKIKEIRSFCLKNSKQANIDKYSRYFKEGFDGYGIDQKVYEAQRDFWIADWEKEMTIDKYLELGDKLIPIAKYEEISFVIGFIESKRADYTKSTFDRIGNWFDMGISNWANTDVLCMLILANFLIDRKIDFDKLKEWTTSNSEWQRRAVPVTLVELIKEGLKPATALPLIDPLMLDESKYVQKGIGTLLRGLWKIYPIEIEEYLLKWKDQCGRLIVQYATEKMTREYRKKFRKTK
jgi:3-methyladenine DNA glycosylase AlkD